MKLLSRSNSGHTLHHSHVFSKDDCWIVFDGRNDDTKIGETKIIGVIDVKTGKETVIYAADDSNAFGPGLGAASFAPNQNRVIFIKGLSECNSQTPYGPTRRIGLCVDLNKPTLGIHADARQTNAPFTAGSLRGGTHSHCWSPCGSMISFTYNDEFVDSDLRTVGVMLPWSGKLAVSQGKANNDGSYYSAIVADVVRDPAHGSDQISKAFDECWIGANGYLNSLGERIEHAIAFQGNTKNEQGETVTEIYIVDIDETQIKLDHEAVGHLGEKPRVPEGIIPYRLSHTIKGLSNTRHWLRSSVDGKYIYALSRDETQNNQLIQCCTSSGETMYLSHFDFSIDSPINISYQGDKLTFIAQGKVYLFEIESRKLILLFQQSEDQLDVVGAPVFSRNGQMIAFNQFVDIGGRVNSQIKIIDLRVMDNR